MAKVQLRLKTKNGQHLLETVNKEDEVLVLKAMILSLTGLDVNNCRLKVGYPPEDLFLVDDSQKVGEIFPNGREVLTIEEENSGNNGNVFVKTLSQSIKPLIPQRRVKRIDVPSNNSCLFVSVNYCVTGGILQEKCPHLRKLIADTVRADPITFNAGFLEKSNADYCEWIMNEDRWGGGIELAILSAHYKKEIAAIDIQNARINRFGEDKNYKDRMFLIFDGIHYDPLVVETGSKQETIFSVNDIEVEKMALEFAANAKKNNQFTDLNRMVLKCNICHKPLSQDDARLHAKNTGHVDFSEITH